MANIVPKRGLAVTCAAAGCLCVVRCSAFGSTLDRNYRLGDDPQENAVVGQVVGSRQRRWRITRSIARRRSSFPGFDAKWRSDVREHSDHRSAGRDLANERGVQFTGSAINTCRAMVWAVRARVPPRMERVSSG